MVQIQRRGSAFSLVELLVAIAIIGILATLALISFDNARRNSRDGRRQTDVKEYSGAITKRSITKGDYKVGNANGTGYGRINKGTTTIASILLSEGYTSTIAKDPGFRNGTDNDPDYVLIVCTSGAGWPLADGTKKADQFAVWGRLEREGSQVERDNAGNACGGWNTGGTYPSAAYDYPATAKSAATFPQGKISTSPTERSKYYVSGSGRIK
jgi:prepilin-type N-terminal cleavage/methylation domain-containing protein